MAVKRLDARLVSIYVGGEPTMLEFVFGATSIDEVLDKVDYMSRGSRARTRRSRTRSRTRSSRCSTRAGGRSRCAGRCPAPRR